MTRNTLFYLSALGALLLPSCQQEIALDLPPNEAELVIEAYLVDLDFFIPDTDLNCFGQIFTRDELTLAAFAAAAFPLDSVEKEADYFPFKKVKLSTTTDYFSNSKAPAVRNAIVKLFEDGDLVETLMESNTEPGSYPFTYKPIVGKEYHLEIEALGNFYRTEKELYESVPPLFGLTASYIPTFLRDSCAYYMGINTFEKAGTRDHYRWMFYTNNKFDRSPFSLSVTNDQNFDGLCLINIDVYNSELKPGDTLAVFQMHTSERYYKYITALRQQTAFVGGPFDSPPNPIKGNLKNLTKGTLAHGFFAAGGISANAVIVPDTIPVNGCGI